MLQPSLVKVFQWQNESQIFLFTILFSSQKAFAFYVAFNKIFLLSKVIAFYDFLIDTLIKSKDSYRID